MTARTIDESQPKAAMTNAEGPAARKPLRLWAGVVGVALQWVLWSVVPRVAPDATLVSVFGAIACGLAVVVW